MASTATLNSIEAQKFENLRSAVSGFNHISANEKSDFINLVGRYLSGEAEQVDWSKIKTRTDDIVVPYDALSLFSEGKCRLI
ncbi:UTP--glucose-1-phosphate uridylyltransferase-like [Chenopodium quinoa]|uniref:UTP--glucose-1-phosphate uridylyltransferase-like n=1 Tax=Chenopodium quinoa TaxID=63459 RepID=UPI000B77BAE4|nr:UTP--glucose-1-phosphate uridylyltransferase-like [Chenopodium quinoa]